MVGAADRERLAGADPRHRLGLAHGKVPVRFELRGRPGAPAGDAIEFALASGDRTLNPKLARVQGLVFVRKPAADAIDWTAPRLVCGVFAPGPLCLVTSVNLPLPKLRKIRRGPR